MRDGPTMAPDAPTPPYHLPARHSPGGARDGHRRGVRLPALPDGAADPGLRVGARTLGTHRVRARLRGVSGVPDARASPRPRGRAPLRAHLGNRVLARG